MKKLLLLLIIPFLSFGQDDCGDKPKATKFIDNKLVIIAPYSQEYKVYEKDLKIWEECKNNIALSIEKKLITYYDKNTIDPIEGVWVFYLNNGTKYAKAGIKKSGHITYNEYLLETYYESPLEIYVDSDLYTIGDLIAKYEVVSKTMFSVKTLFAPHPFYGAKSFLKSSIFLELYSGKTRLGFAEKVYPK